MIIKRLLTKENKNIKNKRKNVLKLIIYENILINLEEFYEFAQVNKFILILIENSF